MQVLVFALAMLIAAAGGALAQEVPKDGPVPELDTCRKAALVVLKEKSPDVSEVLLDPDASVVSKADTKVGDTPVKVVVMGEAYLGKKGTEKPYRYVCLISDADKVVLTFFTQQ